MWGTLYPLYLATAMFTSDIIIMMPAKAPTDIASPSATSLLVVDCRFPLLQQTLKGPSFPQESHFLPHAGGPMCPIYIFGVYKSNYSIKNRVRQHFLGFGIGLGEGTHLLTPCQTLCRTRLLGLVWTLLVGHGGGCIF